MKLVDVWKFLVRSRSSLWIIIFNILRSPGCCWNGFHWQETESGEITGKPLPDSMPRAGYPNLSNTSLILNHITAVKLFTCCREWNRNAAQTPGGPAFCCWGNLWKSVLWNMSVEAKFPPPSPFKPDHINPLGRTRPRGLKHHQS